MARVVERSRSSGGGESIARCSRRRWHRAGRDRDRSGDSPSWRRPVVAGGPSMVTWTGAGLRAKTSRRLWAVCRVVSTRISIRSARIRSAICGSLRLTVSCHASARALSWSVTPSGCPHVGVTDKLDLPAIAVLKQGEERLADRVAAEIRRDESDPQSPVGRPVVGMRADLIRQRLGELAAQRRCSARIAWAS